jgi:hypothetical protein
LFQSNQQHYAKTLIGFKPPQALRKQTHDDVSRYCAQLSQISRLP